MTFQIKKNTLTEPIKKKIFDGFGNDAIKSTGINGLSEDPFTFEIFNKDEFVGAIVVQLFWGQLHIKYLFVEEKYRRQGIGQNLMNHALDFGKQSGCDFAFVETMSFQAPVFYQKMGFIRDFSRSGYAKNTTFHYLTKSLSDHHLTPVTRMGVYGVVMQNEKMLTVRQKGGPYAGKLDFPGGGIEFGESPEQTLRRELLEEVAMEFDSMKLIDNLSATFQVNASYQFHHIGMIYQLEGCRSINNQTGAFQHHWINLNTISEADCSALLWKYKVKHLH